MHAVPKSEGGKLGLNNYLGRVYIKGSYSCFAGCSRNIELIGVIIMQYCRLESEPFGFMTVMHTCT